MALRVTEACGVAGIIPDGDAAVPVEVARVVFARLCPDLDFATWVEREGGEGKGVLVAAVTEFPPCQEHRYFRGVPQEHIFAINITTGWVKFNVNDVDAGRSFELWP